MQKTLIKEIQTKVQSTTFIAELILSMGHKSLFVIINVTRKLLKGREIFLQT